nr:hypothetical protein [Agromyces protaetiae]
MLPRPQPPRRVDPARSRRARPHQARLRRLLLPGFRHDHVVVEYVERGGEGNGRWRWRRFDPELAADFTSEFGDPFDPHDLASGEGAPFETAAEGWLAHRAGRTDLSGYGVHPGSPYAGPWFVHGYVLGDLAHRMRTELLLWDGWGAMAEPNEPIPEASVALADRIAQLTVDADRGDADADAALAALWATDDRVRPGRMIATHSPSGREGITDLATHTTAWAAAEA